MLRLYKCMHGYRFYNLRPCAAVGQVVPHAVDYQQFGVGDGISRVFAALHRHQGIVRAVDHKCRSATGWYTPSTRTKKS